MTEFFVGVSAFLFGLVVGSFLNVCICRLPQGESVVSPASRCPGCGASIRWHDNIPVLSYLLLKGRCRNCRMPISWQYPLVEFVAGVIYLVTVAAFGVSLESAVYLVLLSALIVITVVDLKHQIIPDKITLPGIPIGLLCSSIVLPTGFVNAAIGIIVGGGGFYLIALLSRGGMGGGDIKLMAMLGAFLGWKAVMLTTMVGSLLGAAAGIFLMYAKGRGRKHPVPFGPFLAFGALVSLFWGEQLISWYTGFRL